MTHDYKRHGTTTLFAALHVATGEVIHKCVPRHRHREFLRFMAEVEKRVDPALDLHVILDNHSTHKHGKVVDDRNRDPAPYKWTAAVEDILAKVSRANATLATLH